MLAAKPHPYGYNGLSALDFVGWMLDRAGRTGMVKAARLVETARGEAYPDAS